MSQEMNVLCCYSCNMFQVHIVKKAKKWQCKLCNAKQSFTKVYFKGSGKDCRFQVQNFNSLKQEEHQSEESLEKAESNDNDSDDDRFNEFTVPVTESKWTKYLDSSNDNVQSNASKLSNDSNDICEDTDDESLHLNTDNILHPYMQCISVNDSRDLENIQKNADFNNDQNDEFPIIQDSSEVFDDNCTNEKKNAVTESKKRKRIFEDDEEEGDFDISLEF